MLQEKYGDQMKIQDEYIPMSNNRKWKKPSKKAMSNIKNYLENPDLTAISGTISRAIPTKRGSTIQNEVPEPI